MFGPYEGYAPLCEREAVKDMTWITMADERALGAVIDVQRWPLAAAASTSLRKALVLFDGVMDAAVEMFGSRTVEEIEKSFSPESPVVPADYTHVDILDCMIDYIAHHRGALVAYAHLLGRSQKSLILSYPKLW